MGVHWTLLRLAQYAA